MPFGAELRLAVAALEDDVRLERLVLVHVEPVHEQLLALADDVLLATELDDRVTGHRNAGAHPRQTSVYQRFFWLLGRLRRCSRRWPSRRRLLSPAAAAGSAAASSSSASAASPSVDAAAVAAARPSAERGIGHVDQDRRLRGLAVLGASLPRCLRRRAGRLLLPPATSAGAAAGLLRLGRLLAAPLLGRLLRLGLLRDSLEPRRPLRDGLGLRLLRDRPRPSALLGLRGPARGAHGSASRPCASAVIGGSTPASPAVGELRVRRPVEHPRRSEPSRACRPASRRAGDRDVEAVVLSRRRPLGSWRPTSTELDLAAPVPPRPATRAGASPPGRARAPRSGRPARPPSPR